MSVHPASTPDDLTWRAGWDGQLRCQYELLPGEYGCDFTQPVKRADGSTDYRALLGPYRVILVREGNAVRHLNDGPPRTSRGLGLALTSTWMDSDNIADVDCEGAA